MQILLLDYYSQNPKQPMCAIYTIIVNALLDLDLESIFCYAILIQGNLVSL